MALLQVGDGYRFSFEHHPLAFEFQQLKETSDGLYAEIEVLATHEEASGPIYGPVRLNLTSGDSQTRLANTLQKRLPMKGVDWLAMLAKACRETALVYRQGEPVIDLRDVELPSQEWELVAKLLPKDETTIVFAGGGSGKSLFALAVGLSVTTGQPLPGGLEPREQTNVLYLDWETNKVEQRHRLEQLARGMGLKTVPLMHYRRMVRALADDIGTIRRWVHDLSIGLVIIDSIAPACGGKPEDADVALRAMNALRTLDGCSRLVIAHAPKAQLEMASKHPTPFGSVFFENMARSEWQLVRALDEDEERVRVALIHRKVNHGRLHPPIGLRFEFDSEAVRIRSQDISEVPELAEQAPASTRLRAALRYGALDTKELKEMTGLAEVTIRKTLLRMADVMQLERGSRGKPAVWGLRATDEIA